MSTFKKYKKNLSVVYHQGEMYVKSYLTLVARIDIANEELVQLGCWSQTTQKHINYVADLMNLKLVNNWTKF